MKYSSSTRFINIIVNALLLAGFAFLGIWFAFFVTPNLLGGKQLPDISLPSIGVGLSAMLGSLGLAGTIVSAVGLCFSVGAFLKGGNDELVRKTFSCYVALGYVLSIFFFLNAILLYRLTTTNLSGDIDLAFAIVVYVILTILSLIASNVPLLHMYGEGEHTNKIMLSIVGGIGAIDVAVALVFGVLFLTNVSYIGSFANSNAVLSKAGIFAICPLVCSIVALGALFGYSGAENHGVVRKSNSFLFSTLVLLNGLSLVGGTLVEHLEYESKMYNISFMAKLYGARFAEAEEFFVMGYITGGLVILLGALVAYFTFFPPKKALQENNY